ncbi:Serine/threonine-protein phosphatase 1 regulatory subunit 10 [Stylophora pistillata]|uniref:Serine/threonine-protein phosphatase 1 regulatory subunit 10 n=1 Tax=Stylophora pistillata TaxID=50429 RepID=A0A2B4S1I8_STYPI|nr:Serine/threonine-protein phosphatase 1 regulatory subunit 10 [Stylophora pistillata]
MSTSGGEPHTLLNALKPMLGSLGDIKTPQEVVQIISLMRNAEKLMSRCIYLNILKATISSAKENETASESLEKFMIVGGWNILNRWLVEAKKTENFPVLVELLEVLRDLPVNIDTLKQGNTGKIIKHLTKLENQDVKKLASGIVKQWMSLVRNQTGTSEKGDKPKLNGSASGDDPLQGSKQAVSSTEGKPAKRMRDNNSTDSNRSPQVEKKSKTLSEVKSDVKQSMAQKNVSKTKVIPPQPKPVAMESAGFMNALTIAASAAPARKRKRVSTASKTGTTNTSTSVSLTTTTKPTYTGILDAILDSQSQTHGQEDGREKEKENKDKEADSSSNNKSGSSPNGSPDDTSAPSGDIGDFSKGSESSEKENSPNAASQASTDTVASAVDDVEEKPAKKSKKGKKVTWPDDDANLAIFHYFEMDEDERALVRHPVNFLDAAHNEMVRERQLVEQAKRLSEDIMTERIKKTREASILADIFLTKSSLPDSPAEPEPDNQKGSSEEPRVIPHDEKGTTHVPAKAPVVSSNNNSSVQLPPALMSLLSSASSTAAGSVSQGSGDRGPYNTVQALLDKIMKPTPQSNSPNMAPGSQSLSQNEPGSSSLPPALQHILEPLQQNKMGPPRVQGPGQGHGPGPMPSMGPGAGLLGAAPGDPMGSLNVFRPSGPMGPRGVQGPHLRPDMPPHFQGPGGPRQGPPIGPLFPNPEGPMMGPRMRGHMPMRMQGGPGIGRAMPTGPRPLLPEMAQRDDFHSDQFDDGGEYGDEDEEGEPGDMSMRGRGRGMPRGRARGRGRGRGTPPVCRHFVSKRGCLRGNTCHFLHPGVNGPPV